MIVPLISDISCKFGGAAGVFVEARRNERKSDDDDEESFVFDVNP